MRLVTQVVTCLSAQQGYSTRVVIMPPIVYAEQSLCCYCFASPLGQSQIVKAVAHVFRPRAASAHPLSLPPGQLSFAA